MAGRVCVRSLAALVGYWPHRDATPMALLSAAAASWSVRAARRSL